MIRIIAYLRTSTDKQDLDNQKLTLLEYARKQGRQIDEFIGVSISSAKNTKERRIDELLEKLNKGDILYVTELSRLGRNMREIINIIHEIDDKGVKITFITQPELSTTGDYGNLMIAIYGYFAEAERKIISERTKAALATRKAKGIKLGRKKGAVVRSKYDPYKDRIIELRKMGVPITKIPKLLGMTSYSYAGLRKYVGKI